MKRNLRLWDYYALIQFKFKHLKIKYSAYLAAVTIMCLYAVKQASAQEADPAATAVADIIPLKIGDTIPEYLWHLPLQVVNHPEGKEAITLNDYRGKLIVLDFWGTWCTSCIVAMPAVYRLQREFSDNLMILPVTSDVGLVVEKFLRSNAKVKELNLSSVVNDSLLKAFFRYNSVPHYVWINSEGSVFAVTESHQLTRENVASALSGEYDSLVEKLTIDVKRPLLLSEHVNANQVLYHAMLIKGHQRGLPTRNITRHSDGVIYGRAAVNFPLLTIYEALARRLFWALGEKMSGKQLVIETSKPEGLSYEFGVTDTSRMDWESDNLYTFDVMVPFDNAGHLDSCILSTINNFSGYHASIEYRNVKCFVLRRTSNAVSSRPLPEGGSKSLKHTAMLLMLNKPEVTQNYPVVDESGYGGMIEIGDTAFRNLTHARQELARCGFELVEAQRKLPVFVIRDN
ncbi:Thiol-disulfide isomerase or thioredoxin [Parapedobacter composti]|uniref:Thiol-disulfide isomerase or thioredoxin n=1 Tax=Parapedobacter composti TaxID=623281 RepID=A0A1I1MNI9_9SPHI|nr:TlpA disulfide reductase family protein [Parapedobacter composti]SFC83110.1 Thiol-disulfide isomerase or thioredoxin [Parapedobacter composti]